MISENFKKDVLNQSITFRYRMLSRFKADADYFFRNPHVKFLWALDPVNHADDMIALFESFADNEKPEWLTKEELDMYTNKLKNFNTEKHHG